MHILVLHRVPDSLVRYTEALDHRTHEVVYVGTPDRMETMPVGVPARRLQRPGTGDTAAEVLTAVAGLPSFDIVIALSEYDLLPAGRVREALGVPGQTEDEVLPARDKLVMKAAAQAAGVRVPRSASAAAAGTPGWDGPTVLKPLAGASSEGVRVFPSPAAALRAGRDGDTPAGELEIEEFIEGPIVHVDGILADSRPVAVQASRYVGTCLGYAEGAPLGSVQIDTDPGLVEWTLGCLAAVGISTGPFHLELIETADGPVFLEVGARFGGADVVDTFELATGVRLPAAQLRLLVDGSAGMSADRRPGPDERYGWFVWPGHTLGAAFCRVRGTDRFRDDPLVWRWVERPSDEPVAQVITYADAHVPLAGVLGPGRSTDLEQLLQALFSTVRVEAATPEAAR